MWSRTITVFFRRVQELQGRFKTFQLLASHSQGRRGKYISVYSGCPVVVPAEGLGQRTTRTTKMDNGQLGIPSCDCETDLCLVYNRTVEFAVLYCPYGTRVCIVYYESTSSFFYLLYIQHSSSSFRHVVSNKRWNYDFIPASFRDYDLRSSRSNARRPSHY